MTSGRLGTIKNRRKRYDVKWPVASIRVDPEMQDALVREAERRGTTVSALLREKLKKPLAQYREHERDVKAAWDEAKETWFRQGYRIGYVDGRQRVEPRFELAWLRKYPGLSLR